MPYKDDLTAAQASIYALNQTNAKLKQANTKLKKEVSKERKPAIITAILSALITIGICTAITIAQAAISCNKQEDLESKAAHLLCEEKAAAQSVPSIEPKIVKWVGNASRTCVFYQPKKDTPKVWKRTAVQVHAFEIEKKIKELMTAHKRRQQPTKN
jgi:hypothetical protein